MQKLALVLAVVLLTAVALGDKPHPGTYPGKLTGGSSGGIVCICPDCTSTCYCVFLAGVDSDDALIGEDEDYYYYSCHIEIAGQAPDYVIDIDGQYTMAWDKNE